MKVAILGANGRMGRALLEAVDSTQGISLGATCVRETSAYLGQRAGQLVHLDHDADTEITTLTKDTLLGCSVVIDFTLPETLEHHLAICAEAKTPMIIGTTGLSSTQRDCLDSYAQRLPIVFAANYSVGVTLMARLCQVAASRLADSADIEIIEAHHRHKRDAPSGTAMLIGEAIAQQTNRNLETDGVYARHGDMGEREQRSIGFSTIRGGDIIGEHTALFADVGERLEITHKASSRQTFALGALRAARWIIDKPAGLYSMENVLDLKDILSF
ncbi:4-hydroxy-tetrahydrodipicolinate reductase [Alteromonas oceanisediminis]|uniref:4-hydroxy-tetrahydrodipicolinate reductase n=1 Tax=Alteromonas oceanisediminis TaxID=2836180 RepID=UPI001BD9553C|nr:4-hydroxy-tetrahydrodipicolinate reductase [Alteromonas oceanisediminis]MBT0588086.1 4-hydroxy-tetrahydrodipicolinate reductase [Alteromonas oceanisediminis]